MHSNFIKGTRLVVEEARPKETEGKRIHNLSFRLFFYNPIEGGGSKRLFVGKIGPNVKKHDVLKAFGNFGDIVDILLKEDFAFVVKNYSVIKTKNIIGIFQ